MPEPATVPPICDHPHTGALTPQMLLLAGLGVLFVSVLLVIVIVVPEPKPNQALVFRVVLALGAACIGGVLPGLFHIAAGWLKAGGAVGLMVLVLLLDPSGRLTNPLNGHEQNIADLQAELADLRKRSAVGVQAEEKMQATTSALEQALAKAPPTAVRDDMKIQVAADLAVTHVALASRATSASEAIRHSRAASEQAAKAQAAMQKAAPAVRASPRVVDSTAKLEALKRVPSRIVSPTAPPTTGR